MNTNNIKPLTDYSFSFIIPVYNVNRELFEGCLNSIIAQNFAQYEIIIVNDGSTLPEVDDVCRDFAAKYQNIKYILQENQGSAVARNTGLDHATGDYIMFVDADDVFHETLHQELSKLDGDFEILLMGMGVDFLNGRKKLHIHHEVVDLSDRKDEIYKTVFRFPDALGDFAITSVVAKCFPMKFIRENNIRFQPQLIRMQDLMFMLEAYYAAKKIIYHPILCYVYNINPTSITRKMNINMLDYCFRTHQALQKWCDEHSLGWEWRIYFGNTFMSDGLWLSYLHKDSRVPISTTIKVILKEYERFEVGEAIKHVRFRDLVPFGHGGARIKLFVAKLFGKHIYALFLMAYGLAKRFFRR